MARTFQMIAMQEAGRYRELQRVRDGYVRDAVHRGDRYAVTTFRRAIGVVWLVDDRPSGLAADLEDAGWTAPEGTFHVQHWYELWSRAELALYTRPAGSLRQRLRARFAAVPLRFKLAVQYARVRTQVLWGRLALTDAEQLGARGPAPGRDEALREAREAARMLRRERLGYARVWAELLEAGVEQVSGQPQRARARLEHARTDARAAGFPQLAAAAGYWMEPRAADAADFFAAEGVRNLRAFAGMLVPGFAAARRG